MVISKTPKNFEFKKVISTLDVDLTKQEIKDNIKYGADIMDEAIKEPTLDRFLDRYPKKNTWDDYNAAVILLQKKRALYIAAKAERKDKKANIGDTENE